MNQNLRENKQHGTTLFPIQLYRMLNQEGNLSISYHWHEEIEFIYIIKGHLTLTISGQKYEGCPGELYVINKEELHEIHSDDPEVYYYAYVFPLEALTFESYDYNQNRYLTPLRKQKLSFRPVITENEEFHTEICSELINLIQVYETKKKGYQLYTKSTFLRVISYFIAGDLIISNEQKDSPFDEYKAEQLKNILQYIQTNYQDKLSLEDISSQFNMSPKYFCRYFKDNFQKTFVEYVNAYRINEAAHLLQATDKKIMDIALLCGFDNFSYFIKKFKSLTGYTPLAYRNLDDPSLMH